MDKILVKIKIPSIEETYDMFVSPEMQISNLIKIIVPAIIEASNGRYVRSGIEMISQCDKQRLLNSSHSLKEYGIGDGAFLMLL